MGFYTDARLTGKMAVNCLFGQGKHKVLHIFLYEKFIDRFVDEMEQNFGNKLNDYWILGVPVHSGIEIKSLSKKNVMHVIDIEYIKKPVFIKMAARYSKIVVHGLFMRELTELLCNNPILQKTYISLWGGDYEHALLIKDEKFFNVIEKAKGIINITATENDTMREDFGRTDRLFSNPCNYMDKQIVSFVEGKCSRLPLNIQVGNSATESNNHIDILNKLSKFSNEDVKIYIPLSYGDKSYAQKVEAYGKKIFGEKCEPMLDFMSKDDYNRFLENIDVAIFGMQRQQALGNIQILIENGTKMFFYKDSIDAKIVGDEFGCSIDYIDDIEKMSFEEFMHYEPATAMDSREKMLEVSSSRNFVKNWETVFKD